MPFLSNDRLAEFRQVEATLFHPRKGRDAPPEKDQPISSSDRPSADPSVQRSPIVVIPESHSSSESHSDDLTRPARSSSLFTSIYSVPFTRGPLSKAPQKQETSMSSSMENAMIFQHFSVFEDIKGAVHKFQINTDELANLSDEIDRSTDENPGILTLFDTLKKVQNRALMALKATVDELARSHELHEKLADDPFGDFGQGGIPKSLDLEDHQKKTLEERIRCNLTTHLIQITSLAAQEYQSVMTRHSKRVQARAERRIRLIYPQMDDRTFAMYVEELAKVSDGGRVNAGIIDEVMRNNGIITDATVEGTALFDKKTLTFCCDDIQDKLRDVKALEDNVSSLHAMFVDLAAMVDRGQDLTNSIEFQMLQAADYSVETNQALSKAKIQQRKRNKRAMRFSGIFLIILLAVILSIVLSTTQG